MQKDHPPLFTSAASSQMGCPMGSSKEVQVSSTYGFLKVGCGRIVDKRGVTSAWNWKVDDRLLESSDLFSSG